MHTRNAIVNQVKSLAQNLQLLSIDSSLEDEAQSLLKRCQYYGKLLHPNGDWLTSEMTEENRPAGTIRRFSRFEVSLSVFPDACSDLHQL